MVAEVRIDGAHELQRLARDLKAAGDKGLRRKLYRGFSRLARPVARAAKDGARTTLPRSGGLADRVAGGSYRTKVRAGRGGGASLSLVVSAKNAGGRVDHGRKRIVAGQMDLAGMDDGRIRHPVYGNRGVWVAQSIQRGWFSDSTQQAGRLARKEALRVLTEVARDLAAKG